MYITGAAPMTGFSGAEFAVTDVYVRRNKLIFTESPTGTPPAKMKWVFERKDTEKKVGVVYNLGLIQPAGSPYWTALGVKMAQGTATPQEAADYVKWWNARAKFVFQNADKLEGFFTVEELN